MARPVVCVVGGGTAGLEGLLMVREKLGSKAELRLIAPEREFRYRPMSPDALFRPALERSLRIADVVHDAGATWVSDRAALVDDMQGVVLTRDGEMVDFDFLLLAAGARSRRVLRQGYVWARGSDPSFLDEIIAQLRAGTVRNVAVAIPRGARWPLPAYELALVLAWTAATRTKARISLITAEERPLGALGADASAAVERELEAAGVEVIASVEAIEGPETDLREPERVDLVLVAEEPADATGALMRRPTDPERVRIDGGAAVAYDRLISLPTMVGPYIAGVASDAAGFVEVDDSLRVCGSERVWAAGGCIAAALEHSALSARQADAAAAGIAASITGATPPSSSAPELAGMLLSGQREHWLAENPPDTREPSTRCLWWPPGRAVGRILAQKIAALDPSVGEAAPTHPVGLLVRAPIALGCTGSHAVGTGLEASEDVRRARMRDVENRQLMAVRRRARAAEAELRALDVQLQTLTAHQQEIIHELQQHGYLRHRPERPRSAAPGSV